MRVMIIVCIIWRMQHLEVLVLYSAVAARIRTTRLELPLLLPQPNSPQ